jgi:hypothetical protein
MAVLALTDAKVVLNSVNLSDHVTKVTLKTSADDLETTAMGATYRARIGGLKDGELGLEFNQDFAAANVDATLFAALGTVVAFTAKATSSANSATNPEYQGSVLVNDYSPLDNGVGELAKVSVSFPTTGTITRATS